MYNRFKLGLVFLVSSLLLFLSSSEVLAQNESIRITGYSPARSGSPLLDASGNSYVSPAGQSTGSNIMASFISSPDRFGPGKTVECPVNLIPPLDYINAGCLVDNDGKLLKDVFFATNTAQGLTSEEIAELKKFLNAGGVVYANTTSTGGDQYVPLFQELGLDISFGERQQDMSPSMSTDPDDTFPTTNGPFGIVPPLRHGPFRSVESSGVNEIAKSVNFGTNILVDTPVGNGYLAVAGSPLHVNVLAVGSNIAYFSNLVALGCKDDNSVVLDVPSFKQNDVVWANDVYDDAVNDTPRCGETMAECACALTSATMVAKYFGVERAPDASSISPQIINDYFKIDSLGFSESNFRWGYLGNFSEDANEALLGDQPKLEQPVRLDYDLGDIKALIQGGKPVILKVNGGAHWVVVKGYDPDDDRLIINDPLHPDPAFGEYTYLDERYTPVLNDSMIVYETTNSDYRYLEFATDSRNHLLVVDSMGNKTGFDPEVGQILEEIPNSNYALDEYYDPSGETSGGGVYFLTIKLPEDGKFKLKIISQDGGAHDVNVYSSDVEGTLAKKVISPVETVENYTFTYTEETAGQEVSVVRNIEAKIDIVPFVSSNTIIPHKLIPTPVAILGADNFDVSGVIQESLTFGKTGKEKSFKSCVKRFVDVDKDGRKDLICFFYGDKTGLEVADYEAILMGKYDNGAIEFVGKDAVEVFNPRFLF